jgi:hypothetical protein
MKNVMFKLLLGVSMVLSANLVSAKEDRPYSDGPVTDVSFIRTKSGMFDEYMKWIATSRKQLMEEEKKAGIITDYKVYFVEPRNPGDPDIILCETFANMAAFDGLDDRLDAVTEKVEGSVKKSNEAAIDRDKLRTVLGSELIREMVLK